MEKFSTENVNYTENYDKIEEITSETSDEDDYSGYFMQSVNAYNMKTKIDTANKLLFAEELDNKEKTSVVTFSVNLFEFEPDYYYSEIESENSVIIEEVEEDETSEKQSIIETNETVDIINAKITTLTLEDNNVDEEIQEECSIVVDQPYNNDTNEIEIPRNQTIETILDADDSESSPSECDDSTVVYSNKCTNSPITPETNAPISHAQSMSTSSPTSPASTSSTSSLIDANFKKIHYPKEIICDKYCKEFYSANEQHQSTTHYQHQPGLILKLHRQCCHNMPDRTKTLPTYNGLNSEYGLSQKQIERKIKNTQRKLKKQQEKMARKEQQELEHMEQCERTFCNWLRQKLNTKFRNKNRSNGNTNSSGRKTDKRGVTSSASSKITPKSSNTFKNNIVIPLTQDVEENNLKLKKYVKYKRKSPKRTFNIHFIVS